MAVANGDVIVNDNQKQFSLPAPEIGDLMATIFNNFKQVETWEEYEIERLPQGIRDTFNSLVLCWAEKVCTEEYNKQAACDDAEEAVNEIIDRATHELSEKIDNIVHDAAKYKIPSIIHEMNLTNSYENSCAQLLMCDALEQLRNLDIEGLVDEAARLKLQNVKDYAQIQMGIVEQSTRQFDVARNTYENYDQHKDVHNSIAPEAALESLLVIAGSAVMATILETIYKDYFDHQIDGYCRLVNDCA